MKVGLAIATTTLDLMSRSGTPAPPTPANTVAPSITGTTTQGQTLTGTDGTWTSSVGSITYARQWLRDGVAIAGATGSTYLLAAGDVGALISFRVTATDANGSSIATSAAVGPVIAANVPWTPAAITTELWLDADDAASITLNGTTVSQWSDKSGNLRHAGQATGVNQPLLVANTFNGRPILRFYHNATMNGFFINNSMADWRNVFIFIVLRPSVVSTMQMILGHSSANVQLRIQTTPVVGAISVQGSAPTIYSNAATTPSGIGISNPTIVNVQLATTASIFFDGVSVYAGSATQTVAFAYNTLGYFNTGTLPLRGDVAEVVVTPVLPQADREKMEGYLAHKWEGAGAANTLAAAHPFKNTAPTL